MFARIAGAKIVISCDRQEDLGENSPNSPYCLTHDSTLVAVATNFFFEIPLDISVRKAAKSRVRN